MTNLEWIRTLSAKDLALIMDYEIHNITKSYTSSLGAIELWLDSERIDCTVENCVFKNQPIMCRVCWARAKRVEDEPQTCEECEHWSDTEDGCADRHGCKTEPQTERSE